MKKNIIDLASESQREDGNLAEDIECKEFDEYFEIIDELRQNMKSSNKDVTEVYRLMTDFELLAGCLMRIYGERGYKQGFKDGIKIQNEIKALN